MKINFLYRTLRSVPVIMMSALMMACGENNPDNPTPTPTPDPDPKPPVVDEKPVVFDFSDSKKSGVSVVSYEDGVLLIETKEDKIPKVGDHICSGPTEAAPYGYLRRVVSVTEVNTKSDMSRLIKLLTDEPILETVFDALTFDTTIPIDLSEIDISSVTDTEGNALSFVKENKGWKIIDSPIKIDLKMAFEGVDEDGNEYPYYEDEKDFVTITPTVVLTPKKLSIPISINNGNFKRLGLETNWDVDLRVKADFWLGKKYDSKMVPLYNIQLKPITIPLGEIPFVITPLFTLYYKFKAEGGASIGFTLIDLTVDVNAGCLYNFEDKKLYPPQEEPYKGKYFCYGKDGVQYRSNEEEGLEMESAPDEMRIKGELRGDLGISFSVGAYGCNLINRIVDGGWFAQKVGWTVADALAAEFCGFVYAQLKAQFGIGDIDKSFSSVDKPSSRIKDGCNFGIYANYSAQFFCQIFQLGWEPKYEPEKPLTIWEPFKNIKSLFFSEFSSFEVTTNHDVLALSSKKHRPLFGYSLFNEADFGFCYKEMNEGMDGLRYVSIRDNNPVTEEDSKSFTQLVKGEIPLARFEEGKSYTVYPYSEVNSYLQQGLRVLRTGRSFVYRGGNSLSDVNLEDVPGTNL